MYPYLESLRAKKKKPFNERFSPDVLELIKIVLQKRFSLNHFKTPKRNFFKQCRNFQEALTVFKKEAGNNTMIEIAATNSGFKATKCQRLGR